MPAHRNPFVRHAGKLVLALLAMGVAGHTYAETPYNAPYKWAIQWLLGPLIIIAVLALFLQKDWLIRKFRSWTVVVIVAAVTVMAGLISGAGYANILNTWVSQPKQVMIEGVVVEKRQNSTPFSSSSTKQVLIKNPHTGAITTLTIFNDEFNSLNVGDLYRRSMTEGLLGFPFSQRPQ